MNKYCIKCGQELPGEAVFCARCGSRQPDTGSAPQNQPPPLPAADTGPFTRAESMRQAVEIAAQRNPGRMWSHWGAPRKYDQGLEKVTGFCATEDNRRRKLGQSPFYYVSPGGAIGQVFAENGRTVKEWVFYTPKDGPEVLAEYARTSGGGMAAQPQPPPLGMAPSAPPPLSRSAAPPPLDRRYTGAPPAAAPKKRGGCLPFFLLVWAGLVYLGWRWDVIGVLKDTRLPYVPVVSEEEVTEEQLAEFARTDEQYRRNGGARNAAEREREAREREEEEEPASPPHSLLPWLYGGIEEED
jgi:hypothetical protein